MTCNRLVFSLDTPVSSTNKTDHHHITEILLKVALNTINQPWTHWEELHSVVIFQSLDQYEGVKHHKLKPYSWTNYIVACWILSGEDKYRLNKILFKLNTRLTLICRVGRVGLGVRKKSRWKLRRTIQIKILVELYLLKIWISGELWLLKCRLWARLQDHVVSWVYWKSWLCALDWYRV